MKALSHSNKKRSGVLPSAHASSSGRRTSGEVASRTEASMMIALALYAIIVVAALVLHAHDVVLGMRDTRPRARIVRRRRVR